jgi:hypothetical protein
MKGREIMVKHRSASSPAGAHKIPIEVRKEQMARLDEEADAKKGEALSDAVVERILFGPDLLDRLLDHHRTLKLSRRVFLDREKGPVATSRHAG